MAKVRMTVISRVKPGRMADFLEEERGWQDQLESMPGSPTISVHMVQSGSQLEGGFNTCISTMEFESGAKYGEFIDAMSPDDVAAMTDQGNHPGAAAEVVDVVISQALID